MRVTVIGVAAAAMLASSCASPGTTPAATAAPAASTTGKFVWHDLSTDNLPAAQRFYGGLLGWEFESVTRLGRPYVVAHDKQGRLIGGLVAIDSVPGKQVSQWVAYASVPSVDAAAAAVEKAGGRTLIAPLEVGTAGRAAVVIDPQGAVLGLARLSAGDPPDPTAPAENTFFWMEYLARDPVAAAAFYTSTFGYTQEVTARAGASEYVVLSLGRARAGILQAPNANMRPVWLPYILVSDPVALAARAKSLGGTVLLEPRPEIRNGSLAVVTDPSGAVVALQKYPF
jgi:hypothetical protein